MPGVDEIEKLRRIIRENRNLNQPPEWSAIHDLNWAALRQNPNYPFRKSNEIKWELKLSSSMCTHQFSWNNHRSFQLWSTFFNGIDWGRTLTTLIMTEYVPSLGESSNFWQFFWKETSTTFKQATLKRKVDIFYLNENRKVDIFKMN